MGKYVLKSVPKTTNNITTGIINFLNAEGHKAVRINVQGQWDEALGIWRKSGSTNGVLDIACTLCPIGKHLVIDVKKGKDKIRKEQLAYMIEVVNCGGLAYAVNDLEHFKEIYFKEIQPILKNAIN